MIDIKLLEQKAKKLTSDEIAEIVALFDMADIDTTNSMHRLGQIYNEKLARAKKSLGCRGCRKKIYDDVKYCIERVWR